MEEKKRRKPREPEKSAESRATLKKIEKISGSVAQDIAVAEEQRQKEACSGRLDVRYSDREVFVYVDRKMRKTVKINRPVLSAASDLCVFWVLTEEGVQKFEWLEEAEEAVERGADKIKGAVHGVSDRWYMLVRTHADRIRNTLYNLRENRAMEIDGDIGADNHGQMLVSGIVAEQGKRVRIEYRDAYVLVEEGEKEHRIAEKGKITRHRMFFDKRNILEIDGNTARHLVLSASREMLRGKESRSVEFDPLQRSMYVEIDGKRHIIEPSFDKFDVEEVAEKETAKKEPSTPAEPPVCHPPPILAFKNGDIFLNGRIFAKTVSGTFLASCTGRYFHQMAHSGVVKVFHIDTRIELVKTLPAVRTEGLLSFHAISTPTSTVTALIYSDSVIVMEHAFRLGVKSSAAIPDTEGAGEVSDIKRYRKDVILKRNGRYFRYFLDRCKNMQKEETPAPPETKSVSLSAENQNKQQKFISIKKSGSFFSVEAASKHVLSAPFASFFHLLHKGYVYSEGFSILFSEGPRISFAFAVSHLRVFNEVDVSKVLVVLSSGQASLLTVRNSQVERKSDLFQNISPDTVEMISPDSFILFESFTVTIFKEAEYIHPVLKWDLPSLPLSFAISSDSLYLCTSRDLYRLSDVAVREGSFLSRSSVGVVF